MSESGVIAAYSVDVNVLISVIAVRVVVVPCIVPVGI
jgi:hypothetical protein